MKFCYCPECKSIQPKNWHSRTLCERCGGECVTFKVKRSAYGYLMYALDAIAVVLIVLYVGYRDWNWEISNFVAEIPESIYFGVVFALIIVSFVLAYLDLKITSEKAAGSAPGMVK